MKLVVSLVACSLVGCAYQSVEPGHLGLRYEAHGGLKRDVLPEGRYNLGWCMFRDCGRIIDFDVTFSTAHQELRTTSQEGLALDLQLSVIYKPIIAELYELDTEVGTNYYDEVVGPEFRSAASGVFARHSYTELAANKEKIEDEIEHDVQRRIKGKHVVIASITLESIAYAPEIQTATRERIVGEQEAVRQKAALENEALKKKQQIENETAEQELKLRMDLAEKKNEREIAEEDALLEKAKATATVTKAKADAEAMTILAKAHADENRAQTQAISPLTVQMKAYEALGQLGGSGTTILLGDFSHIPQFLFPPGFANGAVTPFLGALPHTTGAAGNGGRGAK
ncbi:MAG TPA: SPFH domain-containing protein [Kofleriaceae bacterium]|jgi:regulator of protease activity HflC (stomatin/prohibitin superfamily)